MWQHVVDNLTEKTAKGIALAVSSAVSQGYLQPGEHLPPIRIAARDFRVAPPTVSAAWSLLSRAGLIQTDGRRGTTVRRQATGPRRYRRALESPHAYSRDLSTGIPDPVLLPDLRASIRRINTNLTPRSYLDAPVLPELSAVLSELWPWPDAKITVVDGAMDALNQVAAAHLRFGDLVAVEQPTFPPLLDLFDLLGVKPLGVGFDIGGPLAADLSAAIARGVKAFVFQPHAQNPTGVTMTQSRATELAQILRGRNVIVIEDNAAGAATIGETPSLASTIPNQTVHIRSFSKSHGPDLRLAAIGGPAHLIDPIVERRYLGQGWSSRLLQAILLDLLTHPAAMAQVERAQRNYADRTRRFAAALEQRAVQVPGTNGFNVWISVASEEFALLNLAAYGIRVAAGAPFYIDARASPHIRVTASSIEDDFDEIADAVAASIGGNSWSGPA